jgi:hypothetical protein
VTEQDDRLYSTRRLGLIRQLSDAGVPPLEAESLVARWEAEAERRDVETASFDFWREGAAWVANERRTEHGPRSDVLRQVQDGLDGARWQPVKELGMPDDDEWSGDESARRDDAWKHQRDDAARTERRREPK